MRWGIGFTGSLPVLASSSRVRGWFAAAICATAALGLLSYQQVEAGGETRTLSLYGVNTKERLTTTYMRNGRYVPSELAKLNYFLRDWRRNAVTNIDTTTIDLMWELHADLGSRAPVHIISGYRSAATNSMLKKIGRNVARQSQHIRGKAIDLFFPDVPTERIRNSALVRQIGGVGFYPTSGARGFVHIDSGSVRHWPRIGEQRLAAIMRDYRKTVGARLYRGQPVMVAEAEGEDYKVPAKKAPAAAKAQVAKLEVAEAEVAETKKPSLPKPRPRPIEVLMLAAAQLQIEPAAAPVPKANFATRESPVTDSLGTVAAAETLVELQHTNTAAKGSFAEALRFGIETGTPLIRPLAASASELAEDIFLWPTRLLGSAEGMIRRDGAPQRFGDGMGPVPAVRSDLANFGPPVAKADPIQVATIQLVAAPGEPAVALDPAGETASTAKGDLLVVNRGLKGDLVTTAPRRKLGALQRDDDPSRGKLSTTFEALLDAVE